MARIEDEDRILKWRNDPFVVLRTTTQRPVSPDEHKQWFQAKLNDPRCRLQIVEISGQPAGSVRFDKLEANLCLISIYLIEQFTRQGYGTRVICQASAEVMRDWNVEVAACVRWDNNAGAKAFLNANFRETSQSSYCPPNHRTFVLSQMKSVSHV